MNFITELNQIVDALKADPAYYVAFYNVLLPDADAIGNVESRLGYSLDSSITEFYSQCGGIQLLWLNKGNEDFEKAKNNGLEKLDCNEWLIKGEHLPFNVDGAIWIPSIEKVFFTPWEDHGLEYDAEDFDSTVTLGYEDFKIQVLDWFSSFYDVAFLINGENNPPLVLGEDNQACYTDSHIIHFEEYLQILLKTKGSIPERVKLLNSYDNPTKEGLS